MSNAEIRADAIPEAPSAKGQRGEFYGYRFHHDAAGRFLGEGRAGSGAYFVFGSRETFETAVTEYNILGRPPVQTASTERV
ncbi:MAG: hypothetical protein JWN93_1655 [Hyphomicrobiales bacterium]|nr:hypothetical protein [Hyphomicrobiales bacterium]